MTQTQRDRILELSQQNKGRITPDIVVADAKQKASPLHSMFDWNIRKAAEKYWIATAREIIASVRVTETQERSIITRVAFARDSTVPGNKQGYVQLATIRDKKAEARETIGYEFDRAVAAMNRAREVADVLGQSDLIDSLIRQLLMGREKIAA